MSTSGTKYKDRYEFKEALAAQGYKWLGGGYYSTVYSKPGGNSVVKVGPANDAWPLYIGWALRKGYAGTFAPAVTSLRFYNLGQREAFYVAEMEKLEALYFRHRWQDQARKEHGALMGNCRYLKRTEEIEKTVPKWGKFVRDLRKFRRTSDLGKIKYDAHSDNWMVRKDGSLVLTDPFSGEASRKGTHSAKRTAQRYTSAPSLGSEKNNVGTLQHA